MEFLGMPGFVLGAGFVALIVAMFMSRIKIQVQEWWAWWRAR